MTTIKSAKRPTRKHRLCYAGSYRGYKHSCSALTYSERSDGASAQRQRCANPYAVGDRNATSACS